MRILIGIPFSARLGLVATALMLALSGCEDTGGLATENTPSGASGGGATTVNRDVERPDVFSVTERALWDGRPSLGGVWVAYPANIDPERVIIRNGSNGKSVIGALFRRERENPGPKIQLSSDAAVALGIVAGTPTEISIVVLRREEIVVDVPEAAPNDTAAVPTQNMPAPPRRGALRIPAPAPSAPAAAVNTSAAGLAVIVEQTLDEVPVSGENAEASVQEATTAQGRGDLFRLQKPFIQIATFTEEANANALLEDLVAAGVQAQIQADDPESPTMWRVVSGPYGKRAERTAQLRIIKGLGYVDAFFFK